MPTATVYANGGAIGSGLSSSVQSILGNYAGQGGFSPSPGYSSGSQGFMGANGLPSTFKAAAQQPVGSREWQNQRTNYANQGSVFAGGGGSTPPGMVSTGNSVGGFDRNEQLHGAVSNSIQQGMAQPGMSEQSIQANVNKGQSSIEQGRQQNEMDLQEQAQANGGGNSGATMGALRKMDTDATNQKAALESGIRVDAEKDKLDRQQHATDTGAHLMSAVSDHYGYAKDQPAADDGSGSYKKFSPPLGQGDMQFGAGKGGLFGQGTGPKKSTFAGLGLGSYGNGENGMSMFART